MQSATQSVRLKNAQISKFMEANSDGDVLVIYLKLRPIQDGLHQIEPERA